MRWNAIDKPAATTKQHTPGPWVVLPPEADRNYIRVRGTVVGERYKIAKVMCEPSISGVQFDVAEATANAHLIAASPDMLAALELCDSALSRLPLIPASDPPPWFFKAMHALEVARSAIVAATGGAS